MPALWDPVHRLGAEYTREVLGTLEAKVIEAMGVLREVCGAPRVTAGDPELAAFCFVLTKSLVDEGALSRDRARLFLQSVGAALYHGGAGRREANPRSFCGYLVESARTYAQVVDQRQGDRKRAYIVKHFLAGYGFGNPEDFDLAVSILSLIQPELERGAQFVTAAAGQDPHASAQPVPARPSPAGSHPGVLRTL